MSAVVATALMAAAIALLTSNDLLKDGTFENAVNYSFAEKREFFEAWFVAPRASNRVGSPKDNSTDSFKASDSDSVVKGVLYAVVKSASLTTSPQLPFPSSSILPAKVLPHSGDYMLHVHSGGAIERRLPAAAAGRAIAVLVWIAPLGQSKNAKYNGAIKKPVAMPKSEVSTDPNEVFFSLSLRRRNLSRKEYSASPMGRQPAYLGQWSPLYGVIEVPPIASDAAAEFSLAIYSASGTQAFAVDDMYAVTAADMFDLNDVWEAILEIALASSLG